MYGRVGGASIRFGRTEVQTYLLFWKNREFLFTDDDRSRRRWSSDDSEKSDSRGGLYHTLAARSVYHDAYHDEHDVKNGRWRGFIRDDLITSTWSHGSKWRERQDFYNEEIIKSVVNKEDLESQTAKYSSKLKTTVVRFKSLNNDVSLHTDLTELMS